MQSLQKAVEVDGGGDSKDDNDDLLAVLDIDAAEMEKTIAQNWGFIFNKGVFSLVGGTLALFHSFIFSFMCPSDSGRYVIKQNTTRISDLSL